MKALITLLFASICLAASPITVTVDTKSPGPAIPEDFGGFSFEIARVLPNPDGKYVFSADNKPLVDIFRTMGARSLRIGGNTADRATVPIPTTADMDQLFGFARAAGVKVIYTLRLHDGDPKAAASTAKYLYDKYAGEMSCLAIGNEPNMYAREYPQYKKLWQDYVAAITAPDMAASATFCGPSTTPGKVAWSRDFAKDFAAGGKLKIITQHSYPGGNAEKIEDPAEGRAKLLSPELLTGYQKFFDAFAPTAKQYGLGFRLEEANNYHHGGAKDVSNTLAAALWGLDYQHWWASHGAAGVNFHTGDQVAAGNLTKQCWYASFVTSGRGGYTVWPMGYAIKMFDLGRHGKVVPVKVESADKMNLTAYGVLADDGSLCVTLINKENGSAPKPATVTIATGGGFTRGETITMTAPNNDIAATSGLTIGGDTIHDDANWNGKWTPVPSADQLTVELPPATAMIVKLK
jgi:hypothetical protein